MLSVCDYEIYVKERLERTQMQGEDFRWCVDVCEFEYTAKYLNNFANLKTYTKNPKFSRTP